MLDCTEIAKLIKAKDLTKKNELNISDIWAKMCLENFSSQLISWTDQLNIFFKPKPIQEYNILAADGSQIYPDRHEGVDAFLINIGLTDFNYNNNSKALFFNFPYLFKDIKELPNYQKLMNKSQSEIVDNYRSYLELKQVTEYAIINKADLLLLDGNYPIFDDYKSVEDQPVLVFLNLLHEHQIPIIFYTSFPNSFDLIKIIQEYDKNLNLDNLLDRNLLEQVLPAEHYTTIFRYFKKQINPEYINLSMRFIYLNTGQEIIRLEFPMWLEPNIHKYINYIADQIKKGFGYPVCLAEAHLQAVINSQERSHFYDLIRFFHKIPKRSLKLQRKQLIIS